MYSYFAMPRSINLMHEGPIAFPARIEIVAKLGPAWMFGCDPLSEERRFVVQNSSGVSLFFNANTGKWFVKGGADIPRILGRHSLGAEGHEVILDGDEAHYAFEAHSYEEIAGVGNAFAYALPAALNVFLQAPAVVESIVARTGSAERGYEVWNVKYSVEIISEPDQNTRASRSLSAISLFAEPKLRRLQSALIYFHRAARLADAGHSRWEFLSESILNLAKSLEALIPKEGGRELRDCVRAGLRRLGTPEADIEAWFVPALILRNELDVAHVRLALLGRDEIPVLAQYAEGAIRRFRELFQRLTEQAQAGSLEVAEYVPEQVSSTSKLVARIHEQMKAVDASVA